MVVSAIYTAATEMLGGGEDVKHQCRRPEIVADAAYAVLTSDSHKCTGNFYIDEDVLLHNGVTDFQKYSYHEGEGSIFVVAAVWPYAAVTVAT